MQSWTPDRRCSFSLGVGHGAKNYMQLYFVKGQEKSWALKWYLKLNSFCLLVCHVRVHTCAYTGLPPPPTSSSLSLFCIISLDEMSPVSSLFPHSPYLHISFEYSQINWRYFYSVSLLGISWKIQRLTVVHTQRNSKQQHLMKYANWLLKQET